MALNTNGWDLIYNIKLHKANQVLNDKFNSVVTTEKESFKALNDLNSTLANALADDFKKNGTTASEITVRSVRNLSALSDATSNIKATESEFSEATLEIGHSGIETITITNPPSSSSYNASNFELINLPPDCFCNIWLRVKSITVVNGGDYSTFPTSCTLTGGDGQNARATFSNDGLSAINGITIDNAGEKYTSAPTLSFEGGVGTDATVEVLMEPYIEVIDPGRTTTVPTNIELKEGTNSYPTTVALNLSGKIVVSKQGYYSPNRLLAPLVYITGTLQSGKYYPIFFTSFLFKTPHKNLEISNVKNSIKKCFYVGLESIKDEIWDKLNIDNFKDTDGNYKLENEPNAATIKSYCLALIDDFLQRLYKNNKDFAESYVLKMIRKNVKYADKEDVFSTDKIAELSEPANDLVKAYARFFAGTSVSNLNEQQKFIKQLIDEEIALIKRRVESNVLWIDNQIFYHLNGTQITFAEFNLTTNEEGFIESMIQLLKALVPNPWHYSFKSCTVETQNANLPSTTINILTNTKRLYNRVKLITAPLQFRTGGNENVIKLELPILKLVAILGDKYLVYPTPVASGTESASTFKLPLIVNAHWARSGFKGTTFIPTLENSVSIDLSDSELDNSLKTIMGIVDDDSRTIVKSCLYTLINEEIAKKNFQNNFNRTIGLNLYDEYLATFNTLLMLYKEAYDKLDSAWMFPTSYNVAVKDDANIPATISDSVLSLCCMIKGNPNNDVGYVDINAIPDGATSALVIERSVFGEYMVMPQLLGMSTISEKSPTMEYFDNKVKNLFRVLDSKLGENRLSLVGKDYKGIFGVFKNSEHEIAGKVKDINIRIEENLVRLSLPAVTYDIKDETSWMLANQQVLAYQEYEIYFSGVSAQTFTAQTKIFTLKMEHQKSLFNKILTLGGTQFITTLITTAWLIYNHEKVNTSYIKKEVIKPNQIVPTKEMELSIRYTQSPRRDSGSSNLSKDNSKIDLVEDDWSLSEDLDEERGEADLKPRVLPKEDENVNNIPVHNQEARLNDTPVRFGTKLQFVNRVTVKTASSPPITTLELDKQLREDLRKLREQSSGAGPSSDLMSFYNHFQTFRVSININNHPLLFEVYCDYKQDTKHQEHTLDRLIALMTDKCLSEEDTNAINQIKESVIEMHKLAAKSVQNYPAVKKCYTTYIEFLTIKS